MEQILLELMNDDDSSEDEKVMETAEAMLTTVSNVAVHDVPRHLLLSVISPLERAFKKPREPSISHYVENIVPEMDEYEFLQHFRMPRAMVMDLAGRFEQSETFQKIIGHGGIDAISVEKQLLAFLWYVGHRETGIRDIANRFNLSVSCVHLLIGRMCDSILEMAADGIVWPNKEQREESAQHFHSRYNLNNVIGVLDDHHISVTKPINDHESYRNQNDTFTVHLQAVIDEHFRFIDVFVGYPGSVLSAAVFKKSELFRSLKDLCADQYCLVANSVYPKLPELLLPCYERKKLTEQQQKFNEQFLHCHKDVTKTFKYLKKRFPLLRFIKSRDVVRLVKIVHACCILHNISSLDDLDVLDDPVGGIYRSPKRRKRTNTGRLKS